MTNSIYEFVETKKMFLPIFSGIKFPITYEVWHNMDADIKAAALYLNFYPQITYAWQKFTRYIISDDIAVSAVMLKLMNNVSILDDNPKKFTCSYIYRISWNAIGDAMRNKAASLAYDTEISNVQYSADAEELNLYDLVPCEDDPYEVVKAREALWSIIKGMGPKAEKVVNHLITGDSLKKTRKGSSGYATDRLRDVFVTDEEFDSIVTQLKSNIGHLGYAFDIE